MTEYTEAYVNRHFILTIAAMVIITVLVIGIANVVLPSLIDYVFNPTHVNCTFVDIVTAGLLIK